MRNFWIEATIDGRKTKFTGGPRGETGGFDLTIRRKVNGSSQVALAVRGAMVDGHPTVTVWGPDGELVGVFAVGLTDGT